MKKYTAFFVLCLVSLIGAAIVSAQGFTGPGANPPPPPGFSGQFGFTGPSQAVTAVQAQTFAHKTPVIVRGNIVQAIGGDLYTFRDSSGEIILKIGQKEWRNFGSTISPSDTVEISGEMHWEQKKWQRAPEMHIHAKYMRKL